MVFNLIKEVGLAIIRRTISRGEPSSSHEYLKGAIADSCVGSQALRQQHLLPVCSGRS